MSIIRPIIEPVVGPVALGPLCDVPGSAMEPVLVQAPTGYGWEPPFSIYRRGSTYLTDLDPADYIVPGVTANYYLSQSGDDANDGLTPQTPKRSLFALVTALNAAPPAAVTFNLTPGVHDIGQGNTLSFNFPANLICETGQAFVARLIPVVWEAHTVPNVYRSVSPAIAVGSLHMVDLTDTGGLYGIPPPYAIVGSIANVGSTPRSCRVTSGVLYARQFDSRPPDASVLVLDPTGSVWEQTTAATGRAFYTRNVVFAGGAEAVLVSHSGTGTYFFHDSAFRWSRLDNGFRTSAGGNEILTIMYGGDAAHNVTDGYNYRGLTKAVEIGTLGVLNGRTNAGTSDNGSTSHGSVTSLRINCVYRYNGERNCHDIDTTRNWLLGCKAGDALNAAGSAEPIASANFGVGSGLSLTFMQDCESLGGSTTDAFAIGGAVMHTLRCKGLTAKHTDTDGQIIDGGDVWPAGA